MPNLQLCMLKYRCPKKKRNKKKKRMILLKEKLRKSKIYQHKFFFNTDMESLKISFLCIQNVNSTQYCSGEEIRFIIIQSQISEKIRVLLKTHLVQKLGLGIF